MSAGCGSAGEGPPSEESTPILERPSGEAYGCSVKTPLRNYTPRAWTYGGHALATSSDDALFARVETANNDWSNPSPYEFLVSTLSRSGEAGESHALDLDTPGAVTVPAMTNFGDGFALVWSDDKALWLTLLDADGVAKGDPQTLVNQPQGRGARLHVVAAGETLAVTYVTDEGAAHVALADADGAQRGSPVQLGAGRVVATPELAAHGDAFGVLWSERPADDPDGLSNAKVYFAALGSTGTLGTPVQVSDDAMDGGSTFSAAKVALTAAGDGYVAAWSNLDYGDGDGGGSGVIRVVRLAADGAVREAPTLLARAETDVELVEPTLMPFGDAVALSWARGSIIYVCGGCVPDHAIHTVLLDPDTLAPLSNVVEVAPESGGLLSRDMVVVGEDILTVFDITFHTSVEAGFAALSCTPK